MKPILVVVPLLLLLGSCVKPASSSSTNTAKSETASASTSSSASTAKSESASESASSTNGVSSSSSSSESTSSSSSESSSSSDSSSSSSEPENHQVTAEQFTAVPLESNFKANMKYYYAAGNGSVSLELNMVVADGAATMSAQSYATGAIPDKGTYYWWIDASGYHCYSAEVLDTPFAKGTEENPYVIKGFVPTSQDNVINVPKASYDYASLFTMNGAVRGYLSPINDPAEEKVFSLSDMTYDPLNASYNVSYSYDAVIGGQKSTFNASLSLYFTNGVLMKSTAINYVGSGSDVKREIVYSDRGTNSVTVPDTVKAVPDNTVMTA